MHFLLILILALGLSRFKRFLTLIQLLAAQAAKRTADDSTGNHIGITAIPHIITGDPARDRAKHRTSVAPGVSGAGGRLATGGKQGERENSKRE